MLCLFTDTDSVLFVCLFIEGLAPRATGQSHRVTSGLLQNIHITLTYKTYKQNPKVNPFGIAPIKKMANEGRRCWYHSPFRSGVQYQILKKKKRMDKSNRKLKILYYKRPPATTPTTDTIPATTTPTATSLTTSTLDQVPSRQPPRWPCG